MPDAHLWKNGPIFTGRRWAEALLVEGGRVTAAGAETETARSAPTGTAVHDLGGHLLVPGLIDAHLHVADITRARQGRDLSRARSIAELVDQVRGWAEEQREGTIVGRGWQTDRLRDGRAPTRRDLDRALPDRPVILYHASGHVAAVNSSALTAAGVDRSTSDPSGGRVGREADGAPNGLLYEEAMRPVADLAAAANPPDAAALGRTLDIAASLGLTTVATMNTSPEELAALRTLAEDRVLPIRVRTYVRLSAVDALAPKHLAPSGGDGWFSVPGVKAFADGAFGPRTAWLSRPYSDAPEESGLPVGSEDGLSSALACAAERGLAPAVHAIGDRAVEHAVRSFAPLSGRPRTLARVEHAALTPPEILSELDRVRPALVVQPGFVWSDTWLTDRLGPERARWAYAFRTLLGQGLVLAGSSDAPYDPLDPWRGLAACVDRTAPDGESANPERSEALSPEQAFGLYTASAGTVLGEPDLGSLEVGARADLALTRATDLPRALALGAGSVEATWVDGRPVRVPGRADRG